jgi:predicted ArsR family transcriptional regulator
MHRCSASRTTPTPFHLDRLLEAGLLEAQFRRTGERRGPGAGRPAKLYRAAATGEVVLSVPERRYDLAASILVRAVARADDAARPVSALAQEIAYDDGLRIGSARPGAGVDALLTDLGYTPRRDGDRVVLDNCPFHRIADIERQLVCGMNLALLRGVLDGSGPAPAERAVLDPSAGACCVVLDPA